MEEQTPSNAAVFQQLIPALSASLGQLRRSPGRSDSWVDPSLRALERDHPSLNDRLRRRLGFALRLSELATLDVRERAVLTLGLFFHELADEQARGASRQPSRPWTDYLVRNEYWLAPCYHLAQALDSPNWSEEADRAVVVAKVAIAFDVETLERHGRPLIIMQEMFVNAQSEAAEQIIPILWTEEGQELCDHHFRRQSYRVDVNEVKHSLDALKRAAPRPVMDEPQAPLRFSTRPLGRPQAQPGAKSAPRERSERPIAVPSNGASMDFDRRRQALRAGPGWGALLGDPSASYQDEEELPPPIDEEPEPPEAEVWTPPIPEPAAPEPTPIPKRQAPIAREVREEEPPMAMPSIASAKAGADGADITSRVNELRTQLDKIQRTSAEAQQVLASLAPQMEEFAAWVADLEAVVGRWNVRDERERHAA